MLNFGAYKFPAPGSPPINVRARPASASTVAVSWNKPGNPNGMIQVGK